MWQTIAPSGRTPPRTGSRQRGNAGIEFALAFPLIFVLFYAIIGYGLVMTLEQSLHESAKEGARAAVAVDPKAFSDPALYAAKVNAEASGKVTQALGWLPPTWRDALHIDVDVNEALTTITVTLTYDYATLPLLPTLTFPVLGSVPRVPNNLVVRAVAEL